MKVWVCLVLSSLWVWSAASLLDVMQGAVRGEKDLNLLSIRGPIRFQLFILSLV